MILFLIFSFCFLLYIDSGGHGCNSNSKCRKNHVAFLYKINFERETTYTLNTTNSFHLQHNVTLFLLSFGQKLFRDCFLHLGISGKLAQACTF